VIEGPPTSAVLPFTA